MKEENQLLIQHTDNWVKRVIMKYNICPFARQEVENESIRYVVFEDKKISRIADKLIEEYQYMDTHPEAETSLVILPNGFNHFNRYLEAVYLAEDLINELDYEGTYQIASFHPEYCFEGEDFDSPTNFTNRAPYPTLHIIREASIEKALETYSEPESIPQRNKAFADKKGAQFFIELLKNCAKSD
ncbi:DUF1415 domain-containing protein [Parashewanella spongiae]|uniref:DUF1415 domain-containing protein n=1 Tax=Parashewanella spongiae TaxID=342950 RepID=A0A3A6THB2_9GAMM|nr:DUF1415 domain-containing protein [Parashewanella spongiae]MCL1080115.1 DUF1415 domain-containing protein [Parashewanella spongiae]RJY07077.1 DUF1415 domain-containing protein [Parashewanella spongiae]